MPPLLLSMSPCLQTEDARWYRFRGAVTIESTHGTIGTVRIARTAQAFSLATANIIGNPTSDVGFAEFEDCADLPECVVVSIGSRDPSLCCVLASAPPSSGLFCRS